MKKLIIKFFRWLFFLNDKIEFEEEYNTKPDIKKLKQINLSKAEKAYQARKEMRELIKNKTKKGD